LALAGSAAIAAVVMSLTVPGSASPSKFLTAVIATISSVRTTSTTTRFGTSDICRGRAVALSAVVTAIFGDYGGGCYFREISVAEGRGRWADGVEMICNGR
jgi:hypothetical protein